jgi:hypothetical protein
MFELASYVINQFGNKVLKGGGPLQQQPNFLLLLGVIMIILLIQGYIVMILFNIVVPKMMYSISNEKNKSLEEYELTFTKIGFMDSIALLILIRVLIGR